MKTSGLEIFLPAYLQRATGLETDGTFTTVQPGVTGGIMIRSK